MFLFDRDEAGKPILRSQNVAIDDYLRVRHTGIFNEPVSAGQTVDMDWLIPQLTYQGNNVPSLMVGVKYKVDGGNVGDTIGFSVVDKDNLLGYGAGFVLDGFAEDFYIFPNELSVMKEHKAKLLTGFYIRATYKNNGATDARFVCNILRYVDTQV